MGFTKKTWKNRIAEYINRRRLTMEDGSTNLVTVARDEGTISQEGDAFNAANMNDLEDRIEAGFDEVNQSLTNIKYVTDVNSFVNSGSAFVYSETGNKITIYCYGSVKSDLPLNAILCSGFPAPLFAYSALHIINLTTGEIGSCTIRQNGQLLILNNILKAGHAFCISGVYIKA